MTHPPFKLNEKYQFSADAFMYNVKLRYRMKLCPIIHISVQNIYNFTSTKQNCHEIVNKPDKLTIEYQMSSAARGGSISHLSISIFVIQNITHQVRSHLDPEIRLQ